MIKKIIALILVVSIIVTPSLINVNAKAGDLVTVTKSTYDTYRNSQISQQKQFRFIINGTYNYRNLLPSEYANDATILAYVKNEFQKPNLSVQSITKVMGQENTYTVIAQASFSITLKYKQPGSNTTDGYVINNSLLPKTYLAGTSFSTVYEDLKSINLPKFPGQVFTMWQQKAGFNLSNYTVDNNILFEANYVPMSNYETVAFYVASDNATESELTSGNYNTYSSTPVLENTFSTGIQILPGSNPLEYAPIVSNTPNTNTFGISEYITKNGAFYKFSGWQSLNSIANNNSIKNGPVANAKYTFVARYSKVTNGVPYKYNIDFGIINPNVGVVITDKVSSNINEIFSNTQISAIYEAVDAYNANYPNNKKTFEGFTLISASGNTVNLKATYKDLNATTYYYFDENGNPTMSVEYLAPGVDENSKVVPKLTKYNFSAWKYNSVNKSYDASYVEVGTTPDPKPDDDDKLPAAINGANSFAFASTLKGIVGYKKSVTLRVTAGGSTFTKSEVKTVNNNATVIFTGLNCTAKAGTVSSTYGKTVNVNFNKKGTAYVVASIMYNNKQYVKVYKATIK